MPCPSECIIKPGELRHRVEIYQDNYAGRDSYGEHYPEKPQLMATRFANVQPLRGREFFDAMAQQGNVTHKVTMRYWAALKPDMWFVFNNRRLNILSIINVDEMNVRHEVMCGEEV